MPSFASTATITSFALCGDGKASTTDRSYIKLTWSGRNADKLPEHAILKISLLHPWLRIGGETALRGQQTEPQTRATASRPRD